MRKIVVFLCCLLVLTLPLSGCAAPAVPASPAATEEPAPSAEPQPADARAVVRVTDVGSFLGALADNTIIEFDAAQIKLDRAPDYGFSYDGGCYSWQRMGGGEYELVIRGLDGLTLRSAEGVSASISTGAMSADVLRFENCGDLTLEGLTLGHRGENKNGGCDGDVLSLDGCARVRLERCELYGCGVIGVNAYECENLHVLDCVIRDCLFSALNITACTDFQARDCEILRCGTQSPLAVLCAASCNGFALINSTVRDSQNSYLLDCMNSAAVCLLGCEAAGCRFSNALFCLYDGNVTVSGSALAGNEFGACYGGGAWVAVNGAGEELLSFRDFENMERKSFTGDYVGPIRHVTPGDVETPAPELAPPPSDWDGTLSEVHVQTVDELLAAIAPHTTVYLDADEFDLSKASDYGTGQGAYYSWIDAYDGPELQLHDLQDFSLVGGGMGVTLLSAVPRYANVLSFENCSGLALSDMTIGHRPEPGFCTGDVLELNWCEGLKLDRCGLFGCGEIGIRASCCSDFVISDTNIYQCSYLGAYLEFVQDVLFTGCSVTDCGGEYGFNGLTLYECSGVFFDKDRVPNGDYHVGAMG